MSYILDALKKADRERTLGKVPDLETAQWPADQQSRAKPWQWILGAVLLLNGLVLTLNLLDRDEAVPLNVPAVEQTPSVTPEPQVVPLARAPLETVLEKTTRARVPVPPPVQRPKKPATTASAVTGTPAIRSTKPAVPTGDNEYDLPEWRDLSLDFRSRLSLPRIDVHVYAEDPARRFIMADLKKYREGETLANGALLERIHRDSIQLNYEGTRFRVER